jgi:hypothetical protein
VFLQIVLAWWRLQKVSQKEGVTMATKTQLLKKVRLFCSECMGGPRSGEASLPIPNPAEVEGCTVPHCVWFEYRFGKDPEKSAKRVAAGIRLSHRLKHGLEQNAQDSTNDGADDTLDAQEK